MCDIVEKYAQERAEIAAKEAARKLFEKGVSYEIVKESIGLVFLFIQQPDTCCLAA